MAGPARTFKVLLAHGLGQSGLHFQSQNGRLERMVRQILTDKDLSSNCTISFYYADGPFECLPADFIDYCQGGTEVPEEGSLGRAWSLELDNKSPFNPLPAFRALARFMNEFGPFDGCIGFSQGGVILSLLTSLMDRNRQYTVTLDPYHTILSNEYPNHEMQPPFRFLVCFSSPDIPNDKFSGFWNPKVETPMLQVVGSMDIVVDTASSQRLTRRFRDGKVLLHRGGHSLPRDRICLRQIAEFVVDSLVPSRRSQFPGNLPTELCQNQISEGQKKELVKLTSSGLSPSPSTKLWSNKIVGFRKISRQYRGVIIPIKVRK